MRKVHFVFSLGLFLLSMLIRVAVVKSGVHHYLATRPTYYLILTACFVVFTVFLINYTNVFGKLSRIEIWLYVIALTGTTLNIFEGLFLGVVDYIPLNFHYGIAWLSNGDVLLLPTALTLSISALFKYFRGIKSQPLTKTVSSDT